MTDYWVSVGNVWCKYCKTWYRNTESERRKHEATARHKKSLQRFLKEQREQKAGEESQTLAMEQEVARISKLAEKKFKDDLRMPAKVVTSTKIIASAPSVINPEYLKEQAKLERQQNDEQSQPDATTAPPEAPGFVPPPMPSMPPMPGLPPPGFIPPPFPYDPDLYQQQQQQQQEEAKRRKKFKKHPKYKQYQTLKKQMEQTSDAQKAKIDTYIKAAIQREGIEIEEEESIKSQWDKLIGRVNEKKEEKTTISSIDEYSYYNDPEFFYTEESYEYTKKKEEEQQQLEKQKEKAKEKLEELKRIQEEAKKREEKIYYDNEKIKEHIRENFDQTTGLGKWESVPVEERVIPKLADEPPVITTTSEHDENIIIVHQPSSSELNQENDTISTEPEVETGKRKPGRTLFVHDDDIVKEEAHKISTYNYKESKAVKKRKLAELDALLDMETVKKPKVSIKKRRR